MQHRCSAVPRFVGCPSSAADTEYKLESDMAPADDGTAVHDALAVVVAGAEPDLDVIAIESDVCRKTLGILTAYGRRAWNEFKHLFPNPRAEVKVESELVRGTTDVIHADTETLVVLDWKSGWVRRHSMPQLMSYGHGAVATYGMPSSGYITAIIPWLRFGEAEVLRIDQEMLDRFEAGLRDKERLIGKTYAPNEENCGFCPHRLSCRAWQGFQLSAAQSLRVFDGDVPAPPQMLAALYEDATALKRALANYTTALKATVRQNGELRLPNGTTLRFVDSFKQTLDAQKSWPVLTEDGLTKDDINGCLTLGKGKLMTLVGNRTKKGKAKAQALLMEKLAEAGAVTESISSKLTPQK